jgi:NADH-quinone oxidoreductase subunit N
MLFTQMTFQAALPEYILAVVALGLVLMAAFTGESLGSRRLVKMIALLGYGFAFATTFILPSESQVIFLGLFKIDGFLVYMKGLVLIGAFFACWMVDEDWSDGVEKPEYQVLIMLATLGMLLMISANDLISLYMGLELQSLPLYVIAAMNTRSLKSSEAGLKYFLLGALSSGMLLYGASLIYGFSGSTQFGEIASSIAQNGASSGMIIGVVFLLSGLAFKVSAAPFHMWTPDVYEGAPTPVTALFAIAPKVAAIALLLNVTHFVFADIRLEWMQVIIALSVASMAVGAFGAIMQKDLKRMMAYSSIAHMGYALAGLAAGTQQGAAGVMIYMTTYIFMGAGTFSIILMMRRDGLPVQKLSDLAGLSSTHPYWAFGLMVFMFSMAGIPPLAGFFAKWYVFLAAVNAGLIPLAIIGVLTSVIGAFYYLRIIKLMYFEDVNQPLDTNAPKENIIILSVSLIVTILFLFIIGPLREWTYFAATNFPISGAL